MATSRVSKTSKNKSGFKFRWWMGVILVVIVAGIGIYILRFSQAYTPIGYVDPNATNVTQEGQYLFDLALQEIPGATVSSLKLKAIDSKNSVLESDGGSFCQRTKLSGFKGVDLTGCAVGNQTGDPIGLRIISNRLGDNSKTGRKKICALLSGRASSPSSSTISKLRVTTGTMGSLSNINQNTYDMNFVGDTALACTPDGASINVIPQLDIAAIITPGNNTGSTVVISRVSVTPY